jgi:hypothetical protein
VTVTDESFYEHVTSSGMSRRDFMKLCGVLAGSLSVFGPLGMARKAFADDPRELSRTPSRTLPGRR